MSTHADVSGVFVVHDDDGLEWKVQVYRADPPAQPSVMYVREDDSPIWVRSVFKQWDTAGYVVVSEVDADDPLYGTLNDLVHSSHLVECVHMEAEVFNRGQHVEGSIVERPGTAAQLGVEGVQSGERNIPVGHEAGGV